MIGKYPNILNISTVYSSYYGEFSLIKHRITKVYQPSYSQDLEFCNLLVFPKLKTSCKRKTILTENKINTNQLMKVNKKRTLQTVFSECVR